MFQNKIGGQYPFAMNGGHNHTDVYDYFYSTTYGWSAQYPHQKITLPTLKEHKIERENFAIYMKLTATLINRISNSGNLAYGLFHRFKYTGNLVTTKNLVYLQSFSYTSSLEVRNILPGSNYYMQGIGCNTISSIKSFCLFYNEHLSQCDTTRWDK